MAVLMVSNEGCILDHDVAIANAYKTCISSVACSTSVFCNKRNNGTPTPQSLHPPITSAGDGSQDFPGVSEQLGNVSAVSDQHEVAVLHLEDSVSSRSKCLEPVSEHKFTDVSELGVTSVSNCRVSCLPEHGGNLEVHNVKDCKEETSPLSSAEEDLADSSRSKSPTNTNCIRQRCETTAYSHVSGIQTDQKAELNAAKEISLPPAVQNHQPLISHPLQPKNQTENLKSSSQAKKLGTESDLPQNKLSNIIPSATCLQRLSLKLKHGFFAVNVPYMMDSQFEKVNRHFTQNNSGPDGKICVEDIQRVLTSKRKRKKTAEHSRSSEEEKLHSIHTSLVCAAREQGIFLHHVPIPLDNNQSSRQRAQLDHCGDIFTYLLVNESGMPVHHMGDVKEPVEITAECCCARFSAGELIHRRVCNKSAKAVVLNIEGTCYIVPPCSAFLLSNLQDFCDHLYLELADDGFDLIVLDPPWENKSVKRKRSYDMMCEDFLQDLPMATLLRPGCIVALWVTNNERLEDYSSHTLFPAWGLTVLARWHWIKVTKTGDLISSMDDGHKKPYEVLLLGRLSSSTNTTEVERRELPESKVLMSIPCSLHSKKPSLSEVLSPYLPSNPRCLELFARNLWPGWTSWGREALKHQNMVFYDEVPQSP